MVFAIDYWFIQRRSQTESFYMEMHSLAPTDQPVKWARVNLHKYISPFILGGIRRTNQLTNKDYKPKMLYMYQNGTIWAWMLYFLLMAIAIFTIVFCGYTCFFEALNEYYPEDIEPPSLWSEIALAIDSQQFMGFSVLFTMAMFVLVFTTNS